MSKATVKKLHWRSKVQESFVPLGGGSGELGVAIGGGADYGEFPFVTAAPGGGATVGDVILEIGGTPVLGMTLGDVRGVLNSCPHPIRIKTVSPGSTLCKDLRLYLSKCFTPGSMDSQLQQVIRENLYLRAVPCTTRQPRDGEISGVDYNFVSIEEFFSLEESGALLESGKFKGNYYGTPRPVHIGPESPPITYQEHRNLLRNFRTRSKSLSNLEKAVEEGENSEEDSGLSGGSVGISSAPPTALALSQSWDSRDGVGEENGGSSIATRGGGALPENWELAFSDSGEPYYIDHISKTTSWLDPRAQSREILSKTELPAFTDQPAELKGYSIHTRLSKGPRGFGFNIVGGSKQREFLQVYSVTPGGPPALSTADILVYINDSCVLGLSHKEVVEMLKSVPMGHSVDVVLRRGYPMLYNPDGCPKQPLTPPSASSSSPLEPLSAAATPPSTATAQPLSTPGPGPGPAEPPQPTGLANLNRTSHHNGNYLRVSGISGSGLDANGNAADLVSAPPSYPLSNGILSSSASSACAPSSHSRGIPPPPPPERTSTSQSDSEEGASGGATQRWSLMRYNGNSLPTPSSILHHQSDFSTSTLPISVSKLPLSQPDVCTATTPGAPCQRPTMPQTSLMLPSPMEVPPCGFNGCPANAHPHGGHSAASEGVPGGDGGGELVPVPLGRSEGGGMGFSVTAGGKGGQLALVKRVWDRRQCSSLQPGDAIVKINGADVQSLSFAQVQRVLQKHTKQGEVVLLVYRGGSLFSPVSPNLYKPLPSPLGPSSSHGLPSDLPASSSTSDALVPLHLPHTPQIPPSHSDLSPASPSTDLPSLVQSTSFLDSVPVTLTLEPRDWLGVENGGGAPGVLRPPGGGAGLGAVAKGQADRRGGGAILGVRGQEVELRRRPGEGFGFIIASKDLANGASSMLSHRFVTVRGGSPAARSGQIQPGDQLEAVEGRSVVTLPHRDLAQILRRAGNTLRLTIIPRLNTNSSSMSEGPELDAGGRTRKGHRGRPKQDQCYYSVDLERGPTGFGFSLRGGSEYNMGLYVLGLMEGGPASRSHKIQVSDQLVEINGDSTTGMTHSQAVEQIRRGGHRIHLVLKKGNGYVPDYDHDPRAGSPSSYLYPEEPGVVAVDKTRSLPTKSGRVDRGGGQREREKRRRQRKGGSLGGRSSRGRGEGGRGTPDTDLDWPEEDEEDGEEEEESQVISHRGQKSESKDNGKYTQSLPKNVLRNRQEEVVETVSEVRHSRVKQRSKQLRSRTTQSERRERVEEIKELNIHILPSASKTQAKVGGREGGRRKRDGQREKEREREAEMDVKTRAAGPVVEDSGLEKRDRLPEKERERAPFSFLMPLQDGDAELSNAESGASGASGASFSDQVSVSAASISGSTAGAPPGWGEPRELRGNPWSTQSWCRATNASHNPGPWRSTPSRGATYAGPWIKPSQQKLTQVLMGHRLRGGIDL
ncbi:membrane-associated guanylate kinase, WW and PDZ domain-containing protein 3 isoform X4 [Salmo salar]|uniref:Membrane-associated guanylate kinase, WW and PDZ domain-containing protein 3 isoform X4 n=1 Tax=Salmo salar TaxID=8030 RepID=A0ABM3D105_SALSA|nr:membrane-associated guanylate kinase, WW and PDZ domain-containing protein 3 isoform X4 [Salmo salar]